MPHAPCAMGLLPLLDAMSKSRKNYPLRLPEELYVEIRRWAEAEMRSVNGQIEFLLREAVNRRKKGTQSDNPANRKPESDS